MLRKRRIAVAVVMLTLVTFYFIDFAGLLPEGFSVLERIQFVPAVLSHSVAVLVVLVALTLLLGRLYCSVICPMGIFQDVVARISRGLGKKPKKKKRYQYSPARNHYLIAAYNYGLTSTEKSAFRTSYRSIQGAGLGYCFRTPFGKLELIGTYSPDKTSGSAYSVFFSAGMTF